MQVSAAPAPFLPVRGRTQRQLLDHIECHLDWPELNPRSTAAALGWPLRRVHAALHGEPLSFMRLVSRLRLQRARAMLLESRRPVIEVAFACGFDSLATFYRQYAAAFGSPPAAERDRLPWGIPPKSSAARGRPAGAGCTE